MQRRRVFRRGDALSGENWKCQDHLSLGVPLILMLVLVLVLVLVPGQILALGRALWLVH
jgi:hypothetical protein